MQPQRDEPERPRRAEERPPLPAQGLKLASQAEDTVTLEPMSPPALPRRGHSAHDPSRLPLSNAEREWLERFLGASLPQRTIARLLGLSLAETAACIQALEREAERGGWSRSEIATFKRLHGSHPDEDLARLFGRRVVEVRRKAKELRLSKNKAFLSREYGKGSTQMPRWGAEEIEFLRASYPTESNIALARKLGRSVPSVVSKAHHLGLKKTVDRLRVMGRENVRVRYEDGDQE